MRASIEVTIEPFKTPNFVRVSGGSKEVEPQTFSLSELDPNTLERLCEQFTIEIFKKAGKRRPPQPDGCAQ